MSSDTIFLWMTAALFLVTLVGVVGGVMSIVSGIGSRRRALAATEVGAVELEVVTEPASDTGWGKRLEMPTYWVAICAGLLGVWGFFAKWYEVNHWPSQTMQETLFYFSVLSAISMVFLRPVLGLAKGSAVERGIWQVLLGVVMGCVGATILYADSLSSSPRDLPPALDSYWFAPHISALLFSYGTLAIAAMFALVYFCLSLVRGRKFPKWSRKRTVLVSLLIFAMPWVHFVSFVVIGICLIAAFATNLSAQDTSWVDRWGKRAEELGHRIFCVGFPFLTAGLMMGAYWAQEAWANYWGWDAKEVTALITWFVYIVYFHLRYVGGLRGDKSMAVLFSGAASVFLTFQLFGFLPDSIKSMHRYTDPTFTAREGAEEMESDLIQVQTPPGPISRAGG